MEHLVNYLIYYIILMSLVLTGLYTYSWVQYTKNQFLERDERITRRHPEYSRKWHRAKALNQIVYFFLYIFCFGLKLTCINVILFWILFDGFVNTTILNKTFFDIGTTAKTDVFLQRIVKFTHTSETVVAATLKIGLLIWAIFAFL